MFFKSSVSFLMDLKASFFFFFFNSILSTKKIKIILTNLDEISLW